MYKIVAADQRSPRDGRFIEALGTYQPLQTPAALVLDADRIRYWLSVGAQPTDTVRNLLSREGILLEMHLTRKGLSAEDVQARMESWRSAKQLKAGQPTRKQRRAAKKQSQAAEPTAE